jgi:soluble P-type ATPase
VGEQRRAPRCIHVAIPGRARPLHITRVVLDFNGTLARDGTLIRGVGPRLKRLAAHVDVVVVTSDTFGTARQQLSGLPVRVIVARNGAAKRRALVVMHPAGAVVIGNGVNDVPMLRAAALGIATCGAEGTAAVLLRAAAIVVSDVRDALDLLLRPDRLAATLRR